MINENLKEVINNLMYAIDKDDLMLILYKELRKNAFNNSLTQQKYLKLEAVFNALYNELFKK